MRETDSPPATVPAHHPSTLDDRLLPLQLDCAERERDHFYALLLQARWRLQALERLSELDRRFWRINQPSEVVIDMRDEFDGTNWYLAEPDGRWAGPGNTSTLSIPALMPGEYTLALQVVDAMSPQILTEMRVALNGAPIALEARARAAPPVTLGGRFAVTGREDFERWTFEFRFSSLATPADRGHPDARILAIRIKAIELILIAPAPGQPSNEN